VAGSQAVDNGSRSGPRWSAIRVGQWVTIAALVAISELVAWAGHAGASYVLDGLAILAYLGFRRLRRSPERPS
jgi:hypothetical protein